jgi:hypothetical protein
MARFAGFDGSLVFARLVDAVVGGHWRLGPVASAPGRQSYLEDSNLLRTNWRNVEGELELIDGRDRSFLRDNPGHTPCRPLSIY